MNKNITQLRWLAATLLFVTAMVMPTTAWAQTMYTVFDTETGTLTFKYDNSKPESTDTQKVYDVPTEYLAAINPGWNNNHDSGITKVVFDASFANALPLPSHILPLPTHIIFSQDPHPALLSWMWGAFLHSIHRIICQ